MTSRPNRTSQPLTVTLGGLRERAEKWVERGDYGSLSEVVRAGLRALDREQAEFDALLKAKVEEALADPRRYSHAEVFDTLNARLAARRSAGAL